MGRLKVNFGRLLFALLVVLLMSGCVQLLFEKQHNVSLGDFDYPKERKSPESFVDVNIEKVGSIEFELTSVYAAPKTKSCRYLVNALEGAYSGFYVRVPVNVEEVEGRGHAKVIVDKFDLGRCGWQFSTLVLTVVKEGGNIYYSPILFDTMKSRYGERSRKRFLEIKSVVDDSEVVLKCNPDLAIVNPCFGSSAKLLLKGMRKVDVRIVRSQKKSHELWDEMKRMRKKFRE